MLTPEQVEARKKGIGASEVVILFPEIPNWYCTPYKLWMEKTGRIEKDQELNDYQWWGHEIEPVIAKRYEYETGEKLEYRSDTIIHPRLPFMLCHPDRFVIGKQKLVEIKGVTYNPDTWGEPGTDHVPPEYVLQIQHQLACTEYQEADLIAFFFNYRESCIYHFKRDNELISAMEKTISAFWNNHVLADIPPDLTALSDYKLKFPKNNGMYIDANQDILDCIDILKDIRKRISNEEKLEEKVLQNIFAFIGKADGIKKDGKILCRWKLTKDGRRVFKLSKL